MLAAAVVLDLEPHADVRVPVWPAVVVLSVVNGVGVEGLAVAEPVAEVIEGWKGRQSGFFGMWRVRFAGRDTEGETKRG